ncbi:unnamed protein product [Ilex paraguariensis]|uniref:Cytochrome P450 n=1 Tax=Ilex paraguariensis TaxID=185542 RepID=A0ABC8R7Q4_9AQUA
MDVTLCSIAMSFAVIALLTWAWRVVNWVWLRPKYIEKCLRQQGLCGNSYRLLYGDTKEMAMMRKEAKRKSIDLSDNILPRVLPFYHHIINKYGKNSFSWIGPVARVNIIEPELIKELLTNNYVFKKPTPNPLAKFLVTGLGGYEGEKWAKHRKIINPAFHLDKLKCMVPAMYQSCHELISEWEMLVSKNSWCELDVQPYLQNLTSNVISRTAFGSSYEEGRNIIQLQKEQAQLTLQVLQSVYIPGWRFLPTERNKRMKGINKELHALFTGIINKKEKAKQLGKASDDDDLLSMMLKSNWKEIRENENKEDVGMSIDEVIEECKTFYLAGQESTSNLLLWTMVVLSMYPIWQVRAREEVWHVFGNNKPDFDGLNRLKIVTMILYEVLRLYPPATILTRIIYKKTKLGDMTLPPGVQFLLPILLVHHDHELWGQDAKEFKPERFAEGIAKATKHQFSYFPFSSGPRKCIGNNFAMMEAKLAIAMILQRFSFELSPSYVHAPSYVVTMQPQHGVHIILHKI